MNTNATTASSLDRAKACSDYIVHIRRQLHAIPELGMQERKTSALIIKELNSIKASSLLPFTIEEKKGGIVVDVVINPAAPFTLFRADIDGLPIEEKTDLPFRSIHKGFMHACGHDAHSAMLLGFLKLITRNKDLAPTKNLRLIWQRSEERGPLYSGALKLIEEGVLDNVSHVYALHVDSTQTSGSFHSTSGPLFSATGDLFIEIGAKGGHVMRQTLSLSALQLSMRILSALEQITNHIQILYPHCRIIPTMLHTGEAINIRPSSAHLGVSIRHFVTDEQLPSILAIIKEGIFNEIKNVEGAKLTGFDYNKGYPYTHNTPEEVEKVSSVLLKAGQPLFFKPQSYAGEDFSYFLKKRPGCYYHLGAKVHEAVDHHSPYFVIDESVLWKGTGFWLLLSQGITSSI